MHLYIVYTVIVYWLICTRESFHYSHPWGYPQTPETCLLKITLHHRRHTNLTPKISHVILFLFKQSHKQVLQFFQQFDVIDSLYDRSPARQLLINVGVIILQGIRLDGGGESSCKPVLVQSCFIYFFIYSLFNQANNLRTEFLLYIYNTACCYCRCVGL